MATNDINSTLLGAVDIGSNAMRFLVSSANVYPSGTAFQRVEYMRYPIRLGEESFTTGIISEKKIQKLIKMLQAFGTMFEVFEVLQYKVCATSALRDAKNNEEILKKVFEQTGITIQILSGDTEATLIDKALGGHMQSGNYVHVDVGGGSTEINIVENGEKKHYKSFNLGTVRAIHHTTDAKIWHELQDWVTTHIHELLYTTLGTGGNIKKLHELSGLPQEAPMKRDTLLYIYENLKQMTISQRMEILKLNADRADVILPACEIYLRIMQWAGSEMLLAPNIGLSDGIIIDLWDSMRQNA
ncbi:MAG: phosphatase [Cytophagales bacterium]|nr:phosphatase [Cytophagales bacterium]